MSGRWLKRTRAWGRKHRRFQGWLEASAYLIFILVGFWAMTAISANALLIGTRTAGQTPSHQAIILSPVGKVGWIVVGGLLMLGTLLYARYLQRILPRLPKACLLPLCVVTVAFALLIDTLCGHMSALVIVQGDNDWVSAALKLWTWATYALCAPAVAEWMTRCR